MKTNEAEKMIQDLLPESYKEHQKNIRDAANKAISRLSDEDIRKLAAQFLTLYVESALASKIKDDNKDCLFLHEVIEMNILIALDGRSFKINMGENNND